MTFEGLVVWVASLIDPRLAIFIASLLPVIEPRYGVVLGISLLELSPYESLAASLAALTTLSILLPKAVDLLFDILARASDKSRFAARLNRLAIRLEQASARRARRHVERLKLIGLIVFVAVPLPMTGVYSGALAARALGLRGWKASAALFTGGLLSIIITATPSLILSTPK